MMTSVLFYLFAAVLIFSAIMAVSVRNPVYAVLFLVLAFFNASGLFLMMGAEFLALILLIVYVGAVAVLFLFVVMMLDVSYTSARQQLRRYMPVGAAIVFALTAQLVLVAGTWIVNPAAVKAVETPVETVENTRALGRVLFTDFGYPFQVSGLVLLVAMIGAIVLTMRDRKDSKRQKAGRQVDVQVSDVVEVMHVSSNRGVEL
ncbi:MAG: NADH-quinone oxidoreductase subunit J [Alphaproteobacteria bacterium]|nr:NADH-quinone oxidoreductase subunit J [Alphaproteobacteria bacterium]